MKIKSPKLKNILAVILLVILVIFILVIPFDLPENMGAVDFRPYWSSTFLLVHGEDFSDLQQMDTIERNLTGWTLPITMIAWFAPTGNLFLIPYTFFPFARATFLWLITNIIVLFLSAILIWPKKNKKLWIPLITIFSFSMTLISLKCGQVNTLVMFGLILFLALLRENKDFWAGASLLLTTVKPHLVIITLPLIVLDLIRRKQWRVMMGFMISLVISALILFIINPAWPVRFINLINSGMSTIRSTPTINGLFVLAGQYVIGKYLWIVILGLSIVIWWFYGKAWDLRSLIDVSLLIGMVVSPIGWSYDQIMLLIPVFSIFLWMIKGEIGKQDQWIIILVLVAMNGFSFYQRSLAVNDVWFVWLPMLTGLLYGYAYLRKQRILSKANFKEAT